MFSYELDINLADELGTSRVFGLCNDVRVMMGEALMDDETIEVEMVSGRELKVRLSTPFDLIDNDADSLKEAILEALYENLPARDMASVGRFQMIDCPRPAFLN